MHKFSFAPSARRKMVDLLYGALKTCQLFKVSVVLPPSGKFFAGAHGRVRSRASFRYEAFKRYTKNVAPMH